MRKFMMLLLTLMMLLPACAEETRRIQCSSFSVDLPAAWEVDIDEYTRTAYPVVNHILHPVIVYTGDADYDLIITLYNFESEIRYRLGGAHNKDQAHFTVICEYLGLTDDTHTQPCTLASSKSDIRCFGTCQLPGKNEFLATYFNKAKGLGYTFHLKVKNPGIAPETAQDMLLTLISSLREKGEFYPGDATGKTVIVTSATAHVRTAPDPDSDKLLTAQQGQSFPHYGQSGSWYIINVDGKTGYISNALSALH